MLARHVCCGESVRALADGNWHIPIREKTMECSSGLRTAKDWSAENVSKEFPFF